MGCYNCEHLKTSDKKEGTVNGCLYYCIKIKKYVNGADEGCELYSKDILRKTYESDEIYKDGEKYFNDSTPFATYLVIAVVLVIIAIIVNVF